MKTKKSIKKTIYDEKEILELRKKITELENGWRRTQADFENFKKRAEETRFEQIELEKANFLIKITPVLDNFYRAIEMAPKNNEWLEGVVQIEKQLEDILFNEGLEKIPANTGTKFDPNFHEAISYEENELAPDIIISEFESGWMFGSRVIKPAKVRVSKGK